MLEQQSSPEQTLPAASARITPDELRRAVAKIESRRAEAARLAEIEAQRQANTIPVGEAVQELALDIAPEELWAEVQAERAQAPPPRRLLAESLEQAQSAEPPVRLRPVSESEMAETKQEGILAVRIPLAFALFLTLLSVVRLATVQHSPAASVVYPISQPQVARPKFFQLRVLDQSQGVSTFRLLSEIPDGRAVHCSSVDLSDTFNLYLRRDTDGLLAFRQDKTEKELASWTIIKHGDSVYLRGWTEARMSRKAVESGNFMLYPNPFAPHLKRSHPAPLTLKISEMGGQFHYYPMETMPREELIVTFASPDDHAWEKP